MSQNDDIKHVLGNRKITSSGSSVNLRRKRRRRYLVIPDRERELSTLEDTYCANDNDQREHEVQRKHSYVRSNSKGRLSFHDASASSSRRSIYQRTLPSTQVLSSMMNDTTITEKIETKDAIPSMSNNSLLLKNFYESIGIKGDPTSEFSGTFMADEDSVRSDKKKAQKVIDEIDDPSLSTLNIGQHRRYLQLTTNSKNNQTSKRTFSERKELNKLHSLVLKEQALYRSALDKFHNRYKSRYLIGFESIPLDKNENSCIHGASAFCRWSYLQAQSINREWEKKIVVHPDSTITKACTESSIIGMHHLSKWYGKVRQTLTLHTNKQQSTFDIQDLTCSVVHKSMLTSQELKSRSPTSSLDAKIPNLSPKDIDGTFLQKIPPPTKDSAPKVRLLGNDLTALELAVKHSATIVTTSETLETLLQLPGNHSTKWTLPYIKKRIPVPSQKCSSTPSSSTSVIILDLPIAHAFPSPRVCLEMGFQEGLYQAFLKRYQLLQNDGMSDEMCPLLSEFVYSLWTLPTKKIGVTNTSRNPIRVIVRTLVRLRDSVSKLPIRLRARVEYFHSSVASEANHYRGDRTNHRSRQEIPNSYEKSLWILDQVLFGHQVFCLQYRIDPTTSEVLGCYPTSVAHAFASSQSDGILSGSKTHHNNLGPLDHWKVLIQLLQSIPSIDIPEALLRLPGLVGIKKNSDSFNEEKKLGEIAISVARRDKQSQHQQVQIDNFSVSVHAPCGLSSFSTSSAGTINLDKSMLDQAGTVLLGDKALLDCRRDWEWNKLDRVPYTFPFM